LDSFFLTGKIGSFCGVQKNNFQSGDVGIILEKTADDKEMD